MLGNTGLRSFTKTLVFQISKPSVKVDSRIKPYHRFKVSEDMAPIYAFSESYWRTCAAEARVYMKK